MISPEEFFRKCFPESHIQTFDDAKKGRDLLRSMPGATTSWAALDALNEQGAGIFFNPNPCRGARTEENVIALKWAFVDLDHGTKAEMMERISRSPLKPSVVVESRRGFHVYFRADISRENWGLIIGGLQQFFDGDEAVSSMNEVLRVPGFFHMKDEGNPFLIRIEAVHPVKYSERELLDAFPFESFEQRFQREHGDSLVKLRDLDIRDVLSRLGVEVRKNQIFQDGLGTSMMVNVKGNYVNRFSGLPGSGSTIDVVMHFRDCSLADAISWLRKEYGVKEELGGVTFHPSVLKAEIMQGMRVGVGTPYTWGTSRLDRDFPPIERGNYIVLGGETGLGKTAFSLFMGMQNAKRGRRVLYLSLEMANKGLLRRYARESAGVTAEEYRLGNIDPEKVLSAGAALAEIPETFFLHEFPAHVRYNMGTIKELFVKNKGFDLVFLDNLGFIDGEGDEVNERQSSASRDIVNFCKEFSDQVCVVALHHFKKGNKGKPRRLDDLMGSAKIGHDVSYAIQLWRNQEENIPYQEKAKLLVILQKSREWGDYKMGTVYYHQGKFFDEDQRGKGLSGADLKGIF